MQSEQCARMRREFISDVVHLLFESGRHDRSKKWIWSHFIHPYLGIGYQSFLKETNPRLEPLDYARLVRMVAKFEMLAERGKQILEKQHCQHLLPQGKEMDEVLRQIEDLK